MVHGLSSCGMRAPERTGSVVAARGLSSCGARALECVGSIAVVRGLLVVVHRLQSMHAQ